MASRCDPLILVAEDDDDLRVLISARLRLAGLRVSELEDGPELSDYFALAQACARIPLPDLVLTDVRMPGATGLEVVRAIRRKGIGVPTLLLTGYPTDELEEQAAQLGDTGVLTKPIDLDELAMIVWRRLASAARAPGTALLSAQGW